jgi:glycerol-3-phosphate dehydrogenase (NAD(P)+)
MTNPTPLALPVLILGAGAWGTAMAVQWAQRSAPGMLQLWGRDANAMADMKSARTNARYLPGIRFPDPLEIEDDLQAACQKWQSRTRAHATAAPNETIHGLIILAVPMSGLKEAAESVRKILGPARSGEGLLWLAKGLRQISPGPHPENIQLQWPHQIVAAACPDWPIGACSGPSFAQEVAVSLPVALSIASHDLAWARAVAHACHGGGMRLYATNDLIGVELGGAMKNVLAIAAGVCDGLSLGANARAALLTRGLTEMARLGVALGSEQKTFLGLATLGDLILTATGDLSRNRRVGLALARGEKLPQIVKALGHVAEGVATAPALLALARQHRVDVPITEAVCQLLNTEITAPQAIENLLSREPKDEQAD